MINQTDLKHIISFQFWFIDLLLQDPEKAEIDSRNVKTAARLPIQPPIQSSISPSSDISKYLHNSNLPRKSTTTKPNKHYGWP